jgi:hypothetical protein
MLFGPAHPENFRQQVGRYGDRHYVDNLPEDDIATPSDTLPSVSVVKGAYPKFLNAWIANETAGYAYDHVEQWKDLPRDEMIDLVAKAANRTRDRAAWRGSTVHEMIVDIALGKPIDERLVADDVKPFLPGMVAMVRDLRLHPEVVEAVVFDQTLGYGGTFDCIAHTVKGRGFLDFKTRKKPDAYDEEAAQIAAYAKAEYMIVDINNVATRQFIPAFDFAAAIVITPDGYRVHEVDMKRAYELWRSLLVFWQIKEPRGFYKGVIPVVSQRVDNQIMQEALRQRVIAMPDESKQMLAQRWPQGIPTLKTAGITLSDLMAIEALIERVESDHVLGFTDPAGIAPVPDEGGDTDSESHKALIQRYTDLPDQVRDGVDYYLQNAKPTVRMGTRYNRTVRRFEILRALIELAIHCEGYAEKMAECVDIEALPFWTREHATEVANNYMAIRFGGVVASAEPSVVE